MTAPRHRRPRLALLAGLALAWPALDAAAQKSSTEVYKCGDSQYSATPCPSGKAIDVADPRSAQQQREASAVARRDAAEADRLVAERHAREQAAAPPKTGASRPAKSRPPSNPASSPHKPKSTPKPAAPAPAIAKPPKTATDKPPQALPARSP
jgi:hypothetical protein